MGWADLLSGLGFPGARLDVGTGPPSKPEVRCGKGGEACGLGSGDCCRWW